jgi:hypothetical protein
MSFHRAYYSIIQFCPDRGRAEAANIGVLLLCPELGFVRAKTSGHPRRVRQFFGKGAVDAQRLQLIEQGIEARVRDSYDWSEGLPDLERFISTRANDIQLTPARSMKTSDPELDLDALFRDLVDDSELALVAVAKMSPSPESKALAKLDSGLRVPGVRERIRFDERVVVPVLDKPLDIPYVYANGRVNLVKPVQFEGRAATVTRHASELAIEGDLLQKYSSDGPRQLIVLPSYAGKASQAAENVDSLFYEYKVRVVHEEEVDAFLAEVAETAH